MKYAIDYRNMETAIHGLILFDTQAEAESALKMLKLAEEEDSPNYSQIITTTLDRSCAYETDLNYREFKPVMKNFRYRVFDIGHVAVLFDNVTIINYEQSIDLYGM